MDNRGSSYERAGLGALFAIVCWAALYAHIQITQAGIDYRGLLAPLDRIFDLLLVAFLASLTFCVGRAVNRKLGLVFLNGAEEVSFSIMTGTGATGLAVLGLGLAGLLKPAPVALAAILLAALSRHEVSRLYQILAGWLHSVQTNRRQMIAAILFGVVVAVLMLRAAVPPYVYDEVIYHLAETKRFVEHGRVFPDYDNPYGNMPFLIHMIYALCLLAKADIAARVFSLLLALVTALALYGFCARFLTRRTGWLALFGFFGAGMVVEVAVTTRIDVSLAGMLFLATYAMMIHLDTRQKGWLLASAILSGFALGIKLTAGLWLALIGVMYLTESLLRKRESLTSIIRHGLIYTGIAMLIASPWFIKNLVWFHNPVYPFISGEIAGKSTEGVRYFTAEDERKLNAHLEGARREIPSVVESLERTLAATASMRPERHPLRFWEYATRPEDYNMAEPFHSPNYLFFVAPVFLVLARRGWTLWLAFLSAAFFVATASSTWIGRFLLPAYPPLTILAAHTLTSISGWLHKRFPMRAEVFAGVVVSGALSTAAVPSAIQIYLLHNVGFIGGAFSRHDFLMALADLGVDYFPPIDFVNQRLGPDARVMMFGVEPSYYLQRSHLTDAAWDSTAWRRLLVRNDSLDGVCQDLRRQGVTHVLFNPGLFKNIAYWGRKGSGGVDAMYPSGLRGAGPDYHVQLRNWATFELFRTKFLRPVYTSKGGTIFELEGHPERVH